MNQYAFCRYYYNRVTKKSTWSVPDEVKVFSIFFFSKCSFLCINLSICLFFCFNWEYIHLQLARETLKMESSRGTQESSQDASFHGPTSVSCTTLKTSPPIVVSASEVVCNLIPVGPAVAVQSVAAATPGSSSLCVESPTVVTESNLAQTPLESVPPPAATPRSTEVPVTLANTDTTPM